MEQVEHLRKLERNRPCDGHTSTYYEDPRASRQHKNSLLLEGMRNLLIVEATATATAFRLPPPLPTLLRGFTHAACQLPTNLKIHQRVSLISRSAFDKPDMDGSTEKGCNCQHGFVRPAQHQEALPYLRSHGFEVSTSQKLYRHSARKA